MVEPGPGASNTTQRRDRTHTSVPRQVVTFGRPVRSTRFQVYSREKRVAFMGMESEMNNSWIRVGMVVGVLVILVGGASTLATPDLIKKDTMKCGHLKNDACGTTCEDSVYTHGLCVDDKTGETWAISVQCCCCADGSNHRSFIGG